MSDTTWYMDNHDGTYTTVRRIEEAPYPPVIEISIDENEGDGSSIHTRSFEMTRLGITEQY